LGVGLWGRGAGAAATEGARAAMKHRACKRFWQMGQSAGS
jgi:hypothetical protein